MAAGGGVIAGEFRQRAIDRAHRRYLPSPLPRSLYDRLAAAPTNGHANGTH